MLGRHRRGIGPVWSLPALGSGIAGIWGSGVTLFSCALAARGPAPATLFALLMLLGLGSVVLFIRAMGHCSDRFLRRFGPSGLRAPKPCPEVDAAIPTLQRHATIASAAGFTWIDSFTRGQPPDLIYIFSSDALPLVLTVCRTPLGAVHLMTITFLDEGRVLITTDDQEVRYLPQPPGTFIQVVENVEYHLLTSSHRRALATLDRCGVHALHLSIRSFTRLLAEYNQMVLGWVKGHWFWRGRILLWSLDPLGLQTRRYQGDLEDQIRREREHAINH